MGLYEHLPYTNFHELNLDWMIKEIKRIAAIADSLGDSIEETVYKYISEHPELFPFVTPQMFDADAGKIDHESTDAIKKALAAGVDVFLPTDHGEVYTVRSTIDIYEGYGKRLYGSAGVWRMPDGDGGYLRFKFVDSASGSTTPLFRLGPNVQGFTISDLRISMGTANSGEEAGVGIDAITSQYADRDVTLNNVQFVNATRAIDFVGRGLKVYNCEFNSCTMGVRINWLNGSSDSYGSRSIVFDACRWHSLTPTAIYVQSGHAYGLCVRNCFCDHGVRCLVRADEQAINWAILNNMMEEATASGLNRYVIELNGGADGCSISGNVLAGKNSSNGPWNFIKLGGVSKNVAINNNVVTAIQRDVIDINEATSADYISIVGNVADLTSSHAILRVTSSASTPTHFNISGNVSNVSTRLGTSPVNSNISGNVDSTT